MVEEGRRIIILEKALLSLTIFFFFTRLYGEDTFLMRRMYPSFICFLRPGASVLTQERRSDFFFGLCILVVDNSASVIS
jgi:hypothetical protein